MLPSAPRLGAARPPAKNPLCGVLAGLLTLPALACSDPAGGDDTADTAASDDAGDTAGDTDVTGGVDYPETLVGSFQLQLVAPVAASDTSPASPGKTALVGKVYDGPTPAQVIWEAGTADGECQLYTPRVPFCNTPCGGSAVCVEDDTCEPYPKAGSAGTVTVQGVLLADGATEFTMDPVANTYQPGAGVKLAYPGFAEGDRITLSAAGDVIPAFELSARGVAPLELTNTSIELAAGAPVTLTWEPAADPTRSTVHVKLDISHHGGTKGMIECDTADAGSLELSGALISELLDLGVAGFPSVIVTRRAVGSAAIGDGRVDLVVSSAAERFVEIEGLQSCSGDADCDAGLTCQDDLTCK